jgi:hypothetical protein
MKTLAYWRELANKTYRISLTLFKLMVPIIIIIKILEELGLVEVLSQLLTPVMELVGLPGAMGLVWATTLLTNLYGGIVVYASLAPDVPMSVAQVTVISSMMLIAHGLPVEARIAQKAGVSLLLTLVLRLGMAVIFALVADAIYRAGDWLQQPTQLLWTPAARDESLGAWLIGQVEGLALIVAIVFALVLLLDVLQRIGVIQAINRMLRPVLHLLGIGREAETITLVGLTLGISYGGALLINEAEAGHVPPKDVLFSVSLLGLSHSLIEDTLLMMVIGAHLSGILFGRVLFTLVVIYLMVKLVRRCSASTVERYLVRSVRRQAFSPAP